MPTGRAATRRLLRPRGAVHLTGPVRRGVRGCRRPGGRISAGPPRPRRARPADPGPARAMDRRLVRRRAAPTSRSPPSTTPALRAVRRGRRAGADRRRLAFGATDRRAAGESKPAPGRSRRGMLVNAAGAWGDQVAERCGRSPASGWSRSGGRWCSCASGARGLARPAVRHRPPRKLLFQGRGRQ